MKKNTPVLLMEISKDQLKKLTSQVNETIAFDTALVTSKTFTAAQLWNIQRNKKAIAQRRYYA